MSSNKMSILDRTKYSSRTITTFNILGAYIIDIYYNYLYRESIKHKEESGSITDSYKKIIYKYVSSINRDKKNSFRAKIYQSLIEGIKNYFCIWNGLNSLSIQECIDKIVKEFIPEDLFDAVDKDKKRDLFYLVVNNIMQSFGKIIVSDFLVRIIDDHDNSENVEILKDSMLDLLLMQRHTMFKKFVDEKTGGVEKVDREIVNKIQEDAKELINERNQLQKQLTNAINECNSRSKQISQVIKKYRELEKNYKQMEMNANQYKDELEQTRSKQNNDSSRYVRLENNFKDLEREFIVLEEENANLQGKLEEYETRKNNRKKANKTNTMDQRDRNEETKSDQRETNRNDQQEMTKQFDVKTANFNNTAPSAPMEVNDRSEANNVNTNDRREYNDRREVNELDDKNYFNDYAGFEPFEDRVVNHNPKRIIGEINNELSEMI